jgi:hypothetical protein
VAYNPCAEFIRANAQTSERVHATAGERKVAVALLLSCGHLRPAPGG